MPPAANAPGPTSEPASTPTPHRVLDCRGLNCPLPIIRVAQAIRAMDTGEVLKMEATDPASVPDMAAWSRRTGHPLLTQHESGGLYSFTVRKAK